MSKSSNINKLSCSDRIAELVFDQSGSLAPVQNAVKLSKSPGSVVLPALICAALAFAGTAHASDQTTDQATDERTAPLTIDDLGFTNVMNNNLFSGSTDAAPVRTYRISSGSLLAGGQSSSPLTASSVMEIESARSYPGSSLGANSPEGSGLVLDSRFAGIGDNDQADGTLNVRRFSTSIRSSDGTLTVGNDWSNFQDFLGQPGLGVGRNAALPGFGYSGNAGVTAEQLRWQPTGRFSNYSVAVENGLESTLVDDALESDSGTKPNLVLSWRSDTDSDSLYRLTALGSQLDLDDGATSDGYGESVGWGLNLAGGWRFGDLVAAMSVTLGNTIDSFILGRLGDSDTAAAASKLQSSDTSLNINPSLSYELDSQSNLHLSLNRFQTSTANAAHGVDTLDTIHVGYSWNPWPSTRFGIEFIGKDVDGRGEMDNSNAVNFAASKRF